MNNLDVAGMLRTCSEACAKTNNKEKLQEIIKELKINLNSKVIKNLSISNKY